MGKNLSDEETVPTEHSQRSNFVRELEERLYTGCSVTFTVPQHAGQTNIADEVLQGLQERGCLTTYIDLDSVSSIAELAHSLLWKHLQFCTGDIGPSTNIIADLLSISAPDVQDKIRDVVDVIDFDHLTEWQLIDVAAEIGQQIAAKVGKRLVVWIQNWEKVADLGGDLLTKRLRAIFQLQSHVTYAFVGADPDLMRTLFTDRQQAFYRFAVMLKFPEE